MFGTFDKLWVERTSSGEKLVYFIEMVDVRHVSDVNWNVPMLFWFVALENLGLYIFAKGKVT